MAESFRQIHTRTAASLPRGVVIVGLALLSWAVVLVAWSAISQSFGFVAGV